MITKAPSSTTLSSLAIPEGNGIPNHQRVVTLTIIRCINVGVFMDLYFKITKFYNVCVLATTLSSLAIPEGNGILKHQRVVTLTIIRCINVGVFMDLYFKITKFYIVCVLATTLSSLAIPEGNGILKHQRVVTLTIIRCINVAVFMDLYFKITKVYIVCVLATTLSSLAIPERNGILNQQRVVTLTIIRCIHGHVFQNKTIMK